MSFRRILLLCGTVVVVTVCFGVGVASAQTGTKAIPKVTAADHAYAIRRKSIMVKFFVTYEKIQSRPIPKLAPGLTGQQKRDITARDEDETVITASRSHKELSALTPPPSLRPLHLASLNMLATVRDTHKDFAAAYRGNDRKKARAAAKAMDERLDAAYLRMTQAGEEAAKKLG
ncbi:MAG: hypothetical protein H7145_20515 [Akkermansiaceae bacterium]|nr:hypothetical protein [Armatimonadota bacterium]